MNNLPSPNGATRRPLAAPAQTSSPSLTVGDVVFILFRHKWKVIGCALAGFAAAFAVYKLHKPTFQSDAKLYIRYVVSDQQASPIGTGNTIKSPDERGETIMSSEIEMLNSADLARQVAQAIGPKKILARNGGGDDLILASNVISKGLGLDIPYRSSIIHVSFKNRDPNIVQPVLRQLVESYLQMHREIDRSLGISGDFLTQETDQLRARLTQTEQDLQKAMSQAGVVSSVAATEQTYGDQIATLRLKLFNAQAELAERLSNRPAAPTHPGNATPAPAPKVQPPPPKSVTDTYGAVLGRISSLAKLENQLLLEYTPQSTRIREIRAQIAAAENQRASLEHQYPALATARFTTGPVATVSPGPGPDTGAMDSAAALQARIRVLTTQLQELMKDADRVAKAEVTITGLQRRLALDETNYKRFAERLEETRLDDAAGSGRVSKISLIEAPTFPALDPSKIGKKIALLAIAGLALGLAWALAIELYLDRTIKRPIDIERHLRMPLFLCLPSSKALLAAPTVTTQPNGRLPAAGTRAGEKLVATPASPLRVYHETLRDRLIGFFESINLTHKPKLVAVTSVGRDAGVTTTAAGLSQSLSEIGEGNVLLVDMTAGQGSAQQFLKGRPVSDLDDVLAARDEAHVQNNLYVVSADSNSDQLSRNLPQRFTKLVPKLKASDFDYIIFDLPPISQISITPRLAGFMDMVLLVIEAEKTDRDLVQRATTLLGQSKTHVGAILNKARNHGPSRPQEDFLFGM